MSGGSVTDKDNGYARVRAELFKDNYAAIEIGVLGYAALEQYENGTAIWQAALWAEMGVPNGNGGWRQPPRSWLRGWFEENDDLVAFWLKGEMLRVARGEITKQQAIEEVARRAVVSMKNRMRHGIDPRNADATIKRKGFDFPLFNMGKLVNTVTYRIVRWQGRYS